MIWLIVSGVLVIHLVSAWLAWGMDFAYFQRRWPSLAQVNYRKDLAEAIFMGLVFGFIGMMLSFSHSRFCQYGFKWIQREPLPEDLFRDIPNQLVERMIVDNDEQPGNVYAGGQR